MTSSICIWEGQEYSEGAETCQNGTLKECVDGRWRTIGVCDNENLPGESRKIEDAEAVKLDAISTAPDLGPLVGERTVYAFTDSILESSYSLYFSGAPTPGGVCGNEITPYKIPLDDVLNLNEVRRPRRIQCKSNPTVFYVAVRFVTA